MPWLLSPHLPIGQGILVPVEIELGVDLLLLAALIVLIGLAKALDYSLVAFLKWIASSIRGLHIPFTHIGIPGAGLAANWVDAGADFLHHWIGAGVIKFEHAAVWFFHNLAALARVMGDSIKGLAYDLLWLYHHVEKFTVPYWVGRLQRWVLHQLVAFAKHPIRYLRHAVAEVQHLGHDVVRLIRQAEAAALHAASVAGHAIARPGTVSIPWIRHEVFGLTWRQLRSLRRRLTRLEALSLGVLGGAVALKMLSRVAPWIRCTNVRRAGRALCRTPVHLLDDLLALTADFFVLTNICRVIPWLETAFNLTAAPLIGQLGRAGAGLCGAGYSHPGGLSVPSLHLPDAVPVQLYLP